MSLLKRLSDRNIQVLIEDGNTPLLKKLIKHCFPNDKTPIKEFPKGRMFLRAHPLDKNKWVLNESPIRNLVMYPIDELREELGKMSSPGETSATFREKKRAYTGHATSETTIDPDSPIAKQGEWKVLEDSPMGKMLKPELTEEMCIQFLKDRNYKILRQVITYEEVK
jgi:hypothetical protein